MTQPIPVAIVLRGGAAGALNPPHWFLNMSVWLIGTVILACQITLQSTVSGPDDAPVPIGVVATIPAAVEDSAVATAVDDSGRPEPLAEQRTDSAGAILYLPAFVGSSRQTLPAFCSQGAADSGLRRLPMRPSFAQPRQVRLRL